jgi:sulfur carrier protein ThiS
MNPAGIFFGLFGPQSMTYSTGGKADMHIQVRLYSHLKRHAPEGKMVFPLNLPAGATVKTVLEHLELNDQVQKIILVNGRPAQGDTILDEGDLVVVFPVVEGG